VSPRRLGARERRIVAGSQLHQDPAGAGDEHRGGGADDATPDEADAPTAHPQRRRGHDISIGSVRRIPVMDA